MKRILVAGRVQGVGFRFATKERALLLGLTGWVRNTSDGSVEILASGSTAALNSFEAWLWQGPPASRVTQVKTTAVEVDPVFGFAIR